MEILKKTIDEMQKDVTGAARLKLYKGNCTVIGRKSEKSLYHEPLLRLRRIRFTIRRMQRGFIRLNALRLQNPKDNERIVNRVHGQ